MIAIPILALIAFSPSLPQREPEFSALLQVDASDAPMHIIHTTETLQVRPGPIALVYAKWIPGEHMPSGPIENLVNLHFFVGSNELQWRRDLVDLNVFHMDIPSGVKEMTIKLDYLTPTGSGSYGASPSTNADLGVINWYEDALWPQGVIPDEIKVIASLKVPSGWKNGGSLDVDNLNGDTVNYLPTTVALLNDHPVVIGQHFRHLELFPASSDVGEHAIDMIADSDWALNVPDSRIASYKRLVREERAVFGGVGHYRKYHWLLTLSDNLGSFGVEHHECADDRGAENMMTDDDASRDAAILLPHEFFHSWNGKTLRPAGLVNGGFEKPMKDDGLWVYEGMTNYYGEVLAARCGLMSFNDYTDTLASDFASVNIPGRSWRPLQDTADAAPFLYASPGEWSGLRRGTDFYAEGSLIWLEVDAKIRELTQKQKSLDDFCALFEGGDSNGKIYVKSYEANDVYETLNKIAPNDWKNFFETRLLSKDPSAPQAGLTAAGYRMVWNDTPNRFAGESSQVNASNSLGLRISPDGSVTDSYPGYPAFNAGIPVGAKIIAIDGRQFSEEELKRDLIAGEKDNAPLELIFKNGATYKTAKIDYHGGLRNPHLEKIQNSPDVISQIVAPRTKISP